MMRYWKNYNYNVIHYEYENVKKKKRADVIFFKLNPNLKHTK